MIHMLKSTTKFSDYEMKYAGEFNFTYEKKNNKKAPFQGLLISIGWG